MPRRAAEACGSMAAETELEMAARHVREAEAVVQQQAERLIRTVSPDGRERASALLAIYERTLQLHRNLLKYLNGPRSDHQP